MRRMLGVLTAAALLVTGVAFAPVAQADNASADSSADARAYQPPPIEFGPCTNASLKRAGAECGQLTVPVDYAKPRGPKISVAISRLKHTTPDAQYQGVMLVNPGGPGASGLSLSVLQRYVPNGVGNSYDWIGFDPRGVGDSVPSLSCDGSYTGYNRPFYVPVTPKLEQVWLDKAAGYSKACAAAGGDLLNHMKTTDTVADMDSIRKALGAKQINYYGFSYGTYLGQVYATLHPDRVRRFVFDGVVNPRRVWAQANYDQDVAFERTIKIYFDWLATHDDVYHLGTGGAAIEGTYYRILNELRKKPAAGGTIGPDEWTDTFLSAGYYVYGWDDIAHAFAAAANHQDFSLIKALFDEANAQGPGADNGYAVYSAVQCTDAQWPTNWQQVKNKNWTIYSQAPFETWGNAWFNAPCLTWPAAPSTPVDVDGRLAPPILMIAETYDAATPFSGALVTRRLFPRSVLVEGVGGSTHAGSLSGVACTDDTIAAYLANGALPNRVAGNQSDKQCAPVPPPDPTPVTSGASARAVPESASSTPPNRAQLRVPGFALKG